VLLHSTNQEDHEATDLQIGLLLLDQEGHASNAARWATLPETAPGKKGKPISTFLILKKTT